MIEFDKFSLTNGLEVIVHQDPGTAVVCLNTLYKVGSRNERADKTGFAHLFEHLMFGGSQNVESFDEPLQAVGGENNAFTNTDITNYYTTVPANNVETAFWLESDRMKSLSFKPNVLEVQRSVVIEEFKQRYLNQPYGNAWHLIRKEAYKKHPYQWPTIGKSIDHIENATMTDVKEFFNRYYHPANAILVIAGNITLDKAQALTEKWYGDIAPGPTKGMAIGNEPQQLEKNFLAVNEDVPSDMIYKCFHMSGRADDLYVPTDLLSDLLGRGKSSILHQTLVLEKRVFSNINAYVTGSVDPGLLVIQGQVSQGQDIEEANNAIDDTLLKIRNSPLKAPLEKVKNLAASSLVFGEAEILNRAMNLAYATFVSDTDDVNNELDKIKMVSTDDIKSVFDKVIKSTNETLLFYQKSNR
jgi:zinc protease